MEQRLLNELEKLVSFRPVTADSSATSALIDYVAERLLRLGLIVEKQLNGQYPSVVAGTRSTKSSRLLLQAHIDVVPAQDELFEVKQRDDRFLGRGTYDMLFATASYLIALEDLKADGRLSDLDIGILLTSDEEVGGKTCSQPQIEAYDCDICFLPDAGGKDRLSITSKGVLELEITTIGKSGHAARPNEYINPIYMLSDVIQQLRQLFPNDDPSATTASITVVSGGQAYNQVPDTARLVVDIRYIPTINPNKYIAEIREITDAHNAKLKILELEPGFKVDPKHPLLQQFIKHYELRTQGKIQFIQAPGATDARFFAPKNTPVIMIRPDGGGLHGPDESVVVASLVEFTEVLTAYIAIMRTV